MLTRVALNLLVFALWLVSARLVAYLEDNLYGRLAVVLAGIRGAMLGLAISLGIANLMTAMAGPIGKTGYYFALVALGLSMVGVSFGTILGAVAHLKARR